jgi:hypothetical protein
VRLGDAITLVADNIPRNRSHTQTIEVEEVFMHKDKDIALIKLIHDVQLTGETTYLNIVWSYR